MTHICCFINFSSAVNARKDTEILYGFHINHEN